MGAVHRVKAQFKRRAARRLFETERNVVNDVGTAGFRNGFLRRSTASSAAGAAAEAGHRSKEIFEVHVTGVYRASAGGACGITESRITSPCCRGGGSGVSGGGAAYARMAELVIGLALFCVAENIVSFLYFFESGFRRF